MLHDEEKDRATWAKVRKDVAFLGCFPDYAYQHKEYRHESNFNVGNPDLFKPLIPPEPALSAPRSYERFLDGPSRLMPSLEDPFDENSDPRNLPLHSVLLRAYQKALAAKVRFFGIQDGGLAFGSNDEKFRMFGRIPDHLCRPCTLTKKPVDKRDKPCGRSVIPIDQPCKQFLHVGCSQHQWDMAQGKHLKGGGFFVNSVYEVKSVTALLAREAAEEAQRLLEEREREAQRLRDEADQETLRRQAEEEAQYWPSEDVERYFEQYRYPEVVVTDHMQCPRQDDPTALFDLSPNQKFLAHLYGPDKSTEGCLLFQSAGQGKTCGLLNVAGNYMDQGWLLIWVTSQKLKSTPQKELFESICLNRARKAIDDPEPFTMANGRVLARTRAEKIAYIRTYDQPNSNAQVIMKRYGISLDKQFILTYTEMVEMFIKKNDLYQKLLARDPLKQDPGYKVVMVVDEAHNLISPLLDEDERKALDRLHTSFQWGKKTFHTRQEVYGELSGLGEGKLQGRDILSVFLSESATRSGPLNHAKLFMGTATPMTNSPTELLWLLNLLNPPGARLSLNMDDFYDKAQKRLYPEAVQRFARAVKGKISYMDTSRNSTTFANKVFAGILRSPLQPFHQTLIDQTMQKLRAKGTPWPELVRAQENAVLCAMMKGVMHTPEQIAAYEREAGAIKNLNTEELREYYRQDYERELPRVQEKLEKAERKNHRRAPSKPRRAPSKAKPKAPSKTKKRTVGYATRRTNNTKASDLTTEPLVIQDPSNGTWRLKSLDEYVAGRMSHPPSLGPLPTKGKATSFRAWDANYDKKRMRQLLPYYAPRVHQCIEHIIELERQAVETTGQGLKHTVFVNSKAMKTEPGASFGGRFLASAFHAYEDLFEVYLAYHKKTSEAKAESRPATSGQVTAETRLHISHPEKWGVAVLSSKGWNDIQKFYRGKKLPRGVNKGTDYNPSTVSTTQDAYNKQNKNGTRIKILVLDGGYIEGINGYNTDVSHYLSTGFYPQLNQAAARGVRFCGSKELHYVPGVGATHRMFFYDNVMPVGASPIQEQILKDVPEERQIELNLLEVFQTMCWKFAVDFTLNDAVNNFAPEVQGRIIRTEDYPETYTIETDYPDPGLKTLFIPTEDVLTSFQPRDAIVTDNGKTGVVYKLGMDPGALEIRFDDRPASLELVSISQCRFSKGHTIRCRLPYGLHLARKFLNIGNYRDLYPRATTQGSVNINLPQIALQQVHTVYRESLSNLLLGAVALMRAVRLVSAEPVHFVLPEQETAGFPFASQFCCTWQCDEQGKRILGQPDSIMKEFLKVKTGVSVCFLVLSEQICRTQNSLKTMRLNLLLYHPEAQVVERFDPSGYEPYLYDAPMLDAKLADAFASHGLRFMSGAETNVGATLTHQSRKLHRHQKIEMSSTFASQVFSLLYLNIRLIIPREKQDEVLKYPLQFQQDMMAQLQGDTLTTYISSYADMVLSTRQFVEEHPLYHKEKQFWWNCCLVLSDLCRMERVSKLPSPKTPTPPLLVKSKSPLTSRKRSPSPGPSPNTSTLQTLRNILGQWHGSLW